MVLQKLIEKLQEEGTTPEEILKAIKQRRYMLQKVREYQQRTYKKITISIRKDEIAKLKEYLPELDERYLIYSLAIRKLLHKIPKEIWEPLWEKTKALK